MGAVERACMERRVTPSRVKSRGESSMIKVSAVYTYIVAGLCIV